MFMFLFPLSGQTSSCKNNANHKMLHPEKQELKLEQHLLRNPWRNQDTAVSSLSSESLLEAQRRTARTSDIYWTKVCPRRIHNKHKEEQRFSC